MDLNHWTGIGKLESDPVLSKNNNREQVHFVLIVNRRVQNDSGQWVDTVSNVPCYAFDKRAEAISKHCSANHEVAVEAYYRSWQAAEGQPNHGMIVQNISFGYKPKANV
jgi:single-stranded DNA-binding protein